MQTGSNRTLSREVVHGQELLTHVDGLEADPLA